jgi:glycosyltransferase involved in cell wall biosynthesis
MARAIERLLGDPALRAEMGRAGRERASREFGVAAWCRSLLGLYDRMVERA